MSNNNKQHRITRQQAKDFAKWMFLHEDFDEMLSTTAETIRKNYYRDSGILVSRRFVEDQFKRWTVINDDVFEINKPWTHPKNN